MRGAAALLTALWLMPACVTIAAQEANLSFEIPVTFSGESIFTHRLQSDDPNEATSAAGFRAVISPSLRVGQHWFLYSALQVNSTPYFYYDAYSESEFSTQFHVLQALAGFSSTIGKASLLIKAGQLSSAFGSFPLRYDDAKNPLIDQPAGYVTMLPLRPDQVPCGVRDLLHQQYGAGIRHYCGGSKKEGYGLLPATLYGLAGVEAEMSAGRADARIQITNSSPANPQGLVSSSQHPQWGAGGGYTIGNGLRVGVSAFRGPYLDSVLNALLPAGKTAPDYPATGIGTDAQWAHGRYEVNGEWQRFQFDSPRFKVAPTMNTGYAEVKSILSPRAYAAIRAGVETFGEVRDVSGASAKRWAPSNQVYEFALGYRPNRYQLFKAGYEWVHEGRTSGTRDNVFGIQLVTTFTPVSRALR